MGYKGPNEIFEDVPDSAWTVISVVRISDPEDEIVTRGSPYNLAMLNSHEIGHIGKNAHKSPLVKPMVLERGQMRLPQYEISDTEEH